MDDVLTGLAGIEKRDAGYMINKKNKRLVIIGASLVMIFAISGCALKTYFSHLDSTPTLFLTKTKTAIFPQSPTGISTAASKKTSTESPTFTPAPVSTPCTQLSGTVQRVDVPSTDLGVPLPASIYLPPCYDSSGDYPVLYLFHGQGQTDQYWIDLGVTTIADKAIENGQTPFIMVFPFEERNFDNNATSKFPDAIINDLIPWVDSNYATCTERICRAIGGISRGGGWAIKLAMRHFDLFGTLGGHSYGLMGGDANWVQVNLKTHTVEDFPRIYLDRGDQDSLANDIDYYVKTLQAFGIHPEFHIYPGGHTKSYWSSHVQEYMNFYMAAWPTPFTKP